MFVVVVVFTVMKTTNCFTLLPLEFTVGRRGDFMLSEKLLKLQINQIKWYLISVIMVKITVVFCIMDSL